MVSSIAADARAEPLAAEPDREVAPEPAPQKPSADTTAAPVKEASESPRQKPSGDAKAEPAKEANEVEDSRDEVKLRDGRSVRGRIVQKEPGRWVVIATEDGLRRTIAWDRIEEMIVAPPARRAGTADPARGAWSVRTGGGMTYELRVGVTGILLPAQRFGLTGECATGSGFAPASIYGQFASDSGRAAGGGVGGRLGYMYLSRPDPEATSSWWAMRFGAGLDLQVLHSQIPVGIKPVDGELCTRVARTTHEVETRSTTLVLAHVPLTFGAQLGLGGFEDGVVWRGIVLGVAWAPSYIQTWPWVGDASSYFNPLGVELTLDLTTLHATGKKRSVEPQFRVSLFLAPSLDVTQPTVGMLGFGPTWY